MKSVNLGEGEIFYITVAEAFMAARVMVIDGTLFVDTDIKDRQLCNKLATSALNIQESNIQLKKYLELLGGSEKEFMSYDFDSEGGNHD